MENEFKMKYLDPQEPLEEGLHNRKWVSKEEMLKSFPDQPERSKREDLDDLGHDWKNVPLTDEVWCSKCGEEDHVVKLTRMRCSEHCGDTVRDK